MLEGDARRPRAGLDGELVRPDEAPLAAHDLDAAALREPGEARREALHDGVLARAQLREIELRGAELDAGARELARFADHLGEVQEGLRRDAADVQAHAAELFVALDQHHVEPEIGRSKRSGVTSGPRAQHDHARAPVARGGAWRAAFGALGGAAEALGSALAAGAAPGGAAAPAAARSGAAVAGASAAGSRRRISEPSETRAPTATASSRTTPARGAGISIVALSLSSVISDWSAVTDIARGDQHLDHLDVVEVSDVGDPHLDPSTHALVPGLRHRIRLRMSERTARSRVVKRAASAPSITRWS